MDRASRLSESPPIQQSGFAPAAWSFRTHVVEHLDRTARILAPVAAFAIPVSTSAAEICLGVICFSAFVSVCLDCLCVDGLRERISEIRRNPVALACLALFAWMTIGVFYSSEGLAESFRMLMKYRPLLYVPILFTVLQDKRLQSYCLHSFVAAMYVTLAASFLMKFGLLENKWGNTASYAVFKNYITQSVMMAFAALIVARTIVTTQRYRVLHIAILGLMLFNILYMSDGRTGYVVVIALALLFAKMHLGWRGLGQAFVATAILGMLVYFTSHKFRQRIDRGVVEANLYFHGKAPGKRNSIGTRLRYYDDSLTLASERPLFGYGTGAFKSAYIELAARTGGHTTDNPHNEYLMILVQSGLIGLGLLVWLFFVQWMAALKLPTEQRVLACGVVLALALGSIVNSLLLDTTEGNFFALFTGICFAEFSLRPIATSPEVSSTTDRAALGR
jgi:O-antigen ligase